jgi:hypothetical protein
MATSNAQRFLAKGGVDDELALEMFYGLVLEAFHNQTLLWNSIGGPDGVGSSSFGAGVVSSKVIDSGKSWQFPIIALEDGDPEYHTPGTELLGQQFEVDEGTIGIDGILVKHYDVPFDQIQMSHFDIIRPVAKKLGRALATDFDKKLFAVAIRAGRTAALTKNSMTIHNGGNVVERVAATVAAAYPVTVTGAQNYRDDVANLAQLMDEDNVPEEGRYLAISPYIRRVLSKDTTIYDRDYSIARSNDLNRRIIGLIEGFDILFPTNHLPTTNITTGPTAYQGDFTATVGLPAGVALCGADEGSSAIGYVAANMPELGPIYTFMGKDERKNTHFMKGQMMVGADVLSPWSAGLIQVPSS